MDYLTEPHLKASDTAKLDKFDFQKKKNITVIGMNQYDRMKFINGIYINIVALRKVEGEQSWFFTTSHHHDFIIQVVRKDNLETSFICKSHNQLSKLEHDLKKELPGVMLTLQVKLPHRPKDNENSIETSRMATRSWLRQLANKMEVAESSVFSDFYPPMRQL